ncbi:hypothetical protein ACHAQJ_008085 [Trichoderma viride]
MYSLVTVNQQVSLISISVTPSTFLAALLVLLVFVSFYLPVLPNFTLPRIPIPRFITAATSNDKALPALPSSPTSPDRQLVLRDHSLTLYRRERKDSHSYKEKDRFKKESKDRYKERDYYAKDSPDHGRSSGKARRLFAGFRDSSKPAVYDEELIHSPQRSGDGGRSPGGPGRRVRRLLFPPSVAEARQR